MFALLYPESSLAGDKIQWSNTNRGIQPRLAGQFRLGPKTVGKVRQESHLGVDGWPTLEY